MSTCSGWLPNSRLAATVNPLSSAVSTRSGCSPNSRLAATANSLSSGETDIHRRSTPSRSGVGKSATSEGRRRSMMVLRPSPPRMAASTPSSSDRWPLRNNRPVRTRRPSMVASPPRSRRLAEAMSTRGSAATTGDPTRKSIPQIRFGASGCGCRPAAWAMM